MGPLCEMSMTSAGPEPVVLSMYRQTAVTVDPAWTVITLEVGVVGFGGPLQAIELEVTSSIGPLYEGTRTPLPTPWFTPPTSREEKIV